MAWPSVWVWGLKNASENSVWTSCNHAVELVNICLERIPLLSSLSYLLCTLGGVIYCSKNNWTLLLSPSLELLLKAACHGALMGCTVVHKACTVAPPCQHALAPGAHRCRHLARKEKRP